MAIRVLTFDPLNPSQVQKLEEDLDFYLNDGWEVLTTVAGNRPGVAWGDTSSRFSKVRSPEHMDYVVFVLRNTGLSQNEMQQSEVVKRSQ